MRTDSVLARVESGGSQLEPPRHIGVLLPWANTVVEGELPRLGGGQVVFHYARLVPAGRGTALDDAFLSGLRDAVPGAVLALSKLDLDATLLACTSAGFTAEVPRPRGILSAFGALCTVLASVGAETIALVTPYPSVVTAAEAAAFTEAGITVTGAMSLGADDHYAAVTAAEVFGLVERLTAGQLAAASALVLSCTNWPTLELIAGLEDDLGIPVLSSNLALAAVAVGIGGRS